MVGAPPNAKLRETGQSQGPNRLPERSTQWFILSPREGGKEAAGGYAFGLCRKGKILTMTELDIDLTTIAPDEFVVQPICASAASELAAPNQAKLYLTNRNAQWTAIALTVKKPTDANYPDWQYFSPVPQNCTYPDTNQCLREKKWALTTYVPCDVELNVKFLMQDANGKLSEATPKSPFIRPRCVTGAGWVVID